MIQEALQTATSGMSTMPTGNMMQSAVGSSGANVMNVVGNSNIQQPVSRNLVIFLLVKLNSNQKVSFLVHFVRSVNAATA